MIAYRIISTGSDGNAVVLNHNVLVDCGVSYKALEGCVQSLRLVLLTHIHGDHFNRSTIRRLAAERPTLRFGAGAWLAAPLLEAGVRKSNIDILDANKQYDYSICSVLPVKLVHNVPNQGYKLHFPQGRVIYATDTGSLNGITARDYDLYLVEANFEDEEIRQRIKAKKDAGEYSYELHAMHNHLSKARCDDWVYRNIGAAGQYIYMHQHREREGSL